MSQGIDRMRIRELYTTVSYDDRPAIADIQDVAARIEEFVSERGGLLRVKGRDLIRVIVHYVTFRMRTPYTMIRCVRPVRRPKGWLRVHEHAWLTWLDDVFPAGEWMDEVMYPVFGMQVRSWEAKIPTWREELLTFLPFWMDRSFDPIEEPLDEELDES